MLQLGFLVDAQSDIAHWVSFAEREGICNIELLFNQKANMPNTRVFSNNAKVCATGLWHVNILDPNRERRKEAKNLVLDFLRVSSDLGATVAFIGAGEYKPEDTAANTAIFSEEFPFYQEQASKVGLTLACYLGHQGNFINSLDVLEMVLRKVPSCKLKIDPVGVIRNLKASPYSLIERFGEHIAHVHAKDILRGQNQEFEPPVGMGELQWNIIIGLLHHYDGYLVIEPHGPVWAAHNQRKETHIRLSKRFLEQLI